ncbi:hypothetical protein [Desulfosporosinus sp. SB140]|uniref:hypothetical protein n=1 Tax=Desulfosporosinus paludis TaxID=3115649 RepID=UPI00388EB5DF
MKKSIPIVTFITMACLLSTIFYSTHIVKGDTILPDKNEIQIQKHMKKIDELTKTLAKNEQASTVNDYLATLNAKDLLETAAEYSSYVNSEQDRNDYLSIIAPHLARAWQQGVPYGDVSNIIKDKTYDNIFRMFTVDIATTLNQNKGQSDAELINSIYTIALDNNENTELRRHVLLDLTEPGAYKSPDDMNGKSKLEEIFKEPNLAPEVKSAVITAMRRT